MDQASVDTYAKRAAAGGDAEFDFRGINWFGRDRDISTVGLPARPSRNCAARRRRRAARNISGLAKTRRRAAVGAAMVPAAADRDCMLPLSSWTHPISAHELQVASSILQAARSQRRRRSSPATISPTPASRRARTSTDYRIIHFATHGVVTARAAKCAAQPALLTSFGGNGSDGLLTFREIFDLHLDADLVILSACDTAGKASAAATQQAGLATGGDVALDGLVRAFVGAGGRLVIASHWPVPDDYNATQRLITGLVLGAAGHADGDRAAAVAARS